MTVTDRIRTSRCSIGGEEAHTVAPIAGGARSGSRSHQFLVENPAK
jgi:hypothetical protein